MPSYFKVDMKGMSAMLKGLKGISIAFQQETVKKALIPDLVAMRDEVKAAAPVASGALQRSIQYIVKKYPARGFVFAAVGPRRGASFGSKGKNPSRYAHIVELHQHPFLRPVGDRYRQGFEQRLLSRFMKLLP